MFDGIKIKCSGENLTALEWEDNTPLSFLTVNDKKTGEQRWSEFTERYKALKFSITQTGNFLVQGSIHKYHNDGLHNANDFTIIDVQSVVRELNEVFSIDPKKSHIQTIEFGVNILLTIPAKEFIEGIVSMPKDEFTQMDVKGIKEGKVCQRQQYSIKIYHKESDDNLLRIEVKISKMAALKNYQIKTLSDLCDYSKVYPLLEYLLDLFDEMIWYGDSIKESEVSKAKYIRILKYMTPRKWKQFKTRQARHKFRKSAENLLEEYGALDMKKDVRKMICEKWDLLTMTALNDNKKGDVLTNRENVAADKRLRINHRIRGYFVTPDEFSPEDVKLCLTCKRDISHQRRDSKFCSEKFFGKDGKKCRNVASGKARTIRRRKARELKKQRQQKKQPKTAPGH